MSIFLFLLKGPETNGHRCEDERTVFKLDRVPDRDTTRPDGRGPRSTDVLVISASLTFQNPQSTSKFLNFLLWLF